jgi:hypothetical protein
LHFAIWEKAVIWFGFDAKSHKNQMNFKSRSSFYFLPLYFPFFVSFSNWNMLQDAKDATYNKKLKIISYAHSDSNWLVEWRTQKKHVFFLIVFIRLKRIWFGWFGFDKTQINFELIWIWKNQINFQLIWIWLFFIWFDLKFSDFLYKIIWLGFGNCLNDLDLSNPTKFSKSNTLPWTH